MSARSLQSPASRRPFRDLFFKRCGACCAMRLGGRVGRSEVISRPQTKGCQRKDAHDKKCLRSRNDATYLLASNLGRDTGHWDGHEDRLGDRLRDRMGTPIPIRPPTT